MSSLGADCASPEAGALPNRATPTGGVLSSGLLTASGTVAVSAPVGSSRPKPKTSSRPGAPRSFAVWMILLITSLADMSGQRERMSAAVPATIGAAKLVPCTRQYPPGFAPTRSVAGAVITVSLPVIEPDHRSVPLRSMPATASTPGSRAGYQTPRLLDAVALTLPVQATTTTSLANA